MKSGLKETPSKEAWLAKVLPPRAKIGADSRLISVEGAGRFREALCKQREDLELILIPENLIDPIWSDRPKPCYETIQSLPIEYAGREAGEKLAKLQAFLIEQKYYGFIVTALDEIAWLFNLRGADIPYNPVFFAYAWITPSSAPVLYCHQEKLLDSAGKNCLTNVTVKPYEDILEDMKQTRALVEKESVEYKVLVSNGCNCMLADAIGKDRLVVKQSPIELEKAIKNPIEIEGFRQSHIRDAAALCSYFAWLEDQLAKGAVIDEVDGANKLEQLRR
jgi:Xaa-Pro aminopeptidase